MDYLNEFRDGKLAANLLKQIETEIDPSRQYHFMEFCGGHTHTLFRYGIPDLLPRQINMLHGPGCPVCVLPISAIDRAIYIAQQKDTILCSYGDMLRVPGSQQKTKANSLLTARSQGAEIKMLYSPAEAITLAKEHPNKHVVFFAVGFETTTPPTALVLAEAYNLNLDNFSVFCNHVLTPPAIKGILEPAKQNNEKILDGLIGPGHVSLITGSKAYENLANRYQVPITISGFEPLDILQSLLLLVKQANQHATTVINQYTRAVTSSGNLKARALTNEYLELREEFEWRGLGIMPHSALKIKADYARFDAEQQFKDLANIATGHDNKACECPAVLCGKKKPTDCKLFNKPCTPQNPLGSCMVSSEGACAAYYKYQL